MKGLQFAQKPVATSFSIKGPDKLSGRMREIVIVATSYDEALQQAAAAGILTGTQHDVEVQKVQAEQQAQKQMKLRESQQQQRAQFSVGSRRWHYRMVQIPMALSVNERTTTRGLAAGYLEQVVDEYAQLGWEFYRVDVIGIVVNPGCLGILLGRQPTYTNYYVVTFRTSAEAHRAEPNA